MFSEEMYTPKDNQQLSEKQGTQRVGLAVISQSIISTDVYIFNLCIFKVSESESIFNLKQHNKLLPRITSSETSYLDLSNICIYILHLSKCCNFIFGSYQVTLHQKGDLRVVTYYKIYAAYKILFVKHRDCASCSGCCAN